LATSILVIVTLTIACTSNEVAPSSAPEPHDTTVAPPPAPVESTVRRADDILVEHLGAMTSLMQSHHETPSQGVDALRAYLREHLPEITSTLGLAIVELEGIEDDEARLARFDDMQIKVTMPALLWLGAVQAFDAQVRADAKAREKWQAIRARFNVFGKRLQPLLDLYR